MPASAASEVRLIPLVSLPLVQAGDDLGELLAAALRVQELALEAGDVLVVTQKIVSKAEGRLRQLAAVRPSAPALELARQVEKDPRLVELVLGESVRVVRAVKDLLIVEHRLGCIMANAGIDQSNVGPGEDAAVLLLPVDPDASCRRLRAALERSSGVAIAVLMNDSFGRPWRNGVTGSCIGAAGLEVLRDCRGRPDLFGRPLRVTEIAVGDEIAAAASMLMGQAGESVPAVLMRGLAVGPPSEQTARMLLRPAARDLFR